MLGDANPLEEKTHPGKSTLGVAWALFSAAGFGVMFWLLGIRVVPIPGSAPSVWLIRLTSALITAAVVLMLRQRFAPPGPGANNWILGVGILDTSAYVLNNYGMQQEQSVCGERARVIVRSGDGRSGGNAFG